MTTPAGKTDGGRGQAMLERDRGRGELSRDPAARSDLSQGVAWIALLEERPETRLAAGD
jgi:hypothetical protein